MITDDREENQFICRLGDNIINTVALTSHHPLDICLVVYSFSVSKRQKLIDELFFHRRPYYCCCQQALHSYRYSYRGRLRDPTQNHRKKIYEKAHAHRQIWERQKNPSSCAWYKFALLCGTFVVNVFWACAQQHRAHKSLR